MTLAAELQELTSNSLAEEERQRQAELENKRNEAKGKIDKYIDWLPTGMRLEAKRGKDSFSDTVRFGLHSYLETSLKAFCEANDLSFSVTYTQSAYNADVAFIYITWKKQ